jgi:moderate conductance mechanosensitive channel
VAATGDGGGVLRRGRGMGCSMKRLGRVRAKLLPTIAGLLLLCLYVPALAQTPPADAQSSRSSVSVTELERLVGTLQDEGKRAELIETLKTLIAADRARTPEESPLTLSGRISTALTATWAKTREAFAQLTEQAGRWREELSALGDVFADPARRTRNIHATAAFVGIFALGWLAEWVSWRLLAGARRSIKPGLAAGPGERLWRTVVRMLLDLVSVAVFAVAAYAAALVVSPPPAVQAMALNFVHAYAIGRGLIAFARAILSPEALRSLPLSGAVASKLFTWVRRFVAVGVGGYFLIAAALLVGVPRQAAALLFNVLYLLLAALAVAMILRHRHDVAGWLRRRAAAASGWRVLAPLLTTLAPVWHILAILYVVGFFAVSAFNIEDGFAYMARGTAATVAAIALVVIALALVQGRRRLPETIAAAPAAPTSLADRLASYTPIFRWIAAAGLGLGALLLAFEGWGIEAFKWLAGEGGRQVISAFASIALTFAFAVLAWEVASNAIQRHMAAESDGLPGVTSARGRTLLPLLQKTLFAFLAVMVVLISLSELGIDIAPLLAGAGVAGLAIGFGAQRLVQDVITGFFMLVEDAVAVGDVVAVAGVSGVVEDMSVRALKLRDLAGTLHTVPFSTVSTVSNMTKNFAYYVLDIGVAYHEDPDEVADVCRAILDQMRQEPAFAASILEPLDVFGLDSFGESAIVVKARIKTLPIKQWFIGREFNRRMKQRFDELGIEFPYPHQTIYFGNGDAAAAGGSDGTLAREKEAAP